MNNMKLTCSLIFLLLFFGQYVNAQEEQAAKIIDGKTGEQIIREYEYWVNIKNDWPNLGHYREANAILPSPAPGENRVVFMGNSITEGWILTSPEFFEGKPYIDRGISGQTTPQMLIRFRPDVIDLRPKVVVILCGVNDIAQNTGPSTLEMIEGNITSMAELAKANGIKAILCSVLPAYDFPWRPGLEPAEKIVALNAWIKEYSTKNGFIYLDYFSSMADERNGLKSDYSEDGVHPNLKGYKVMEGLVEKAIATAMHEE
jgi:lysophospholipase L1-like esterase